MNETVSTQQPARIPILPPQLRTHEYLSRLIEHVDQIQQQYGVVVVLDFDLWRKALDQDDLYRLLYVSKVWEDHRAVPGGPLYPDGFPETTSAGGVPWRTP